MSQGLKFEYKAAYYHLLLHLEYPGQHTAEVIKKAFNQRVLKQHPDKSLRVSTGIETVEELKEARDSLLGLGVAGANRVAEAQFKAKYHAKMRWCLSKSDMEMERVKLEFKPLRCLGNMANTPRKRCSICNKLAQMVCLGCSKTQNKIMVFCNKPEDGCLLKHILERH